MKQSLINHWDKGFISGDDGNRYEFSGGDWKLPTSPKVGDRVDFDIEGKKAIQIYIDQTSSIALSSKSKGKKSRISAALITLFVGSVGIGSFYLGTWGWGVVALLSWLFFPSISLFMSLIFGIRYLFISDE